MSASTPGVSAETLKSISTPDRVESRLGTLEFDDGAPSEETAALLYDHLDFVHGVEAYLGAIPGVSLTALRRGFLSAGVEDNSFTLFSELMDSESLFLTGNCDTVYFWGFLDLSDGPMVIDVPSIAAPSGILGTIDDMWFRWVTDIGLPGPDRAEGGRYLLVGPGYDGAAARERFPRLSCPHDTGDADRTGVHDRQRSRDRGRDDPQRVPGLTVRAGGGGDGGRQLPGR